MKGQASYKTFRPGLFSNQSLNAAQLWMRIKIILYSPVLLFCYLQQKYIYFNNVKRFKIQQRRKLNKMSCTLSMLKFIVFVINVLATIFGITTVVICALAIGILYEEHLTFCILGIVVGLIVCIVAFFGCCGAHRESPSYMWTYVALLSIMLVLQLTIIFIYHSKDFGHMATDELELLWANDLKSPGQMAQVEDHFKCCGLHSSKDYAAVNRTIPSSCYDKDKPEGSNLYLDGCRKILARIYVHIGRIIRVTDWILCGIEATSLIFGCILARSFRSPNQMRYITN